jgi:hypothetical protein
MATQLQNSLESVCPTQQQVAPSPRGRRIAKYFTFAKRNLILEAEQLEEYADALEAIEE